MGYNLLFVTVLLLFVEFLSLSLKVIGYQACFQHENESYDTSSDKNGSSKIIEYILMPSI